MVAGAEAGTPGGDVHMNLQRIKKQVEAVQGGTELEGIKHRSMMTPPAQLKLTPAVSFPPRSTGAAAAALTARPGTASTAMTSRTPLSNLGSAAAQSDADYWHRRCGRCASSAASTAGARLNTRHASGARALSLCLPDCASASAPSMRRSIIVPVKLAGSYAAYLLITSHQLGAMCRYEEQATRLAAVETAKRSLEVQVLKSGGTLGDLTGRPSTARSPKSRRTSIAGFASRRMSVGPAGAATGQLQQSTSDVHKKLEGCAEEDVNMLSPRMHESGENAAEINLMPHNDGTPGALAVTLVQVPVAANMRTPGSVFKGSSPLLLRCKC